MFRRNDRHRQEAMFSGPDALPPKQRGLLEGSWAATFYREVFCRTDEGMFAVLYSDLPFRPNVAVNVLFSLECLKAGFGWSDARSPPAACVLSAFPWPKTWGLVSLHRILKSGPHGQGVLFQAEEPDRQLEVSKSRR